MRFYAGQIYLGIAHLHSKLILYRDCKPENLLLKVHLSRMPECARAREPPRARPGQRLHHAVGLRRLREAGVPHLQDERQDRDARVHATRNAQAVAPPTKAPFNTPRWL